MNSSLPTCTIAAFPLTLLGVTGFVTSIFALVLLVMPSRHARVAAAVATLVGVFTIGFGVLARSRMNEAVDLARDRVTDADFTRGHEGAATCARIAFQEGMMPLTAGLIVFVVSAIRRAKGTEQFDDDDDTAP